MKRAIVVALWFATAACGGKPADDPVGTSRGAPLSEARDVTAESFEGWTKIGERSLDEDGRHAFVRVAGDEAPISSLRFVLKHGKLEIKRVVVTFRDGTTWTAMTPMRFGKGVLSRAIDLPGGGGAAEQVDFDYGGVAAGRSSQVEVWAR